MTSAADVVAAKSWSVAGRHGAREDVITFELTSGEIASLRVDLQEGSLLLKAVHPSMRWRVLEWEPRWSAAARVEIRPADGERAAARVIDPGHDVTVIYRVPLVIALAVAGHGGLSVGVHRSLAGRCVDGDDDPRTAAEVEEFGAFLTGVVPSPLPEHREDQVPAES
jgi:hypothetical protein